MAQTDVHDSGYATPGRCYAGIYNFCRSLLDADGSDFDLMESLRRIFLVFNPALDKIKSQMTVKTRFKDSKI